MTGELPDLASRVLGGSVVCTNDDFYGDVHQLIAAGRAVHDPSAYGARGKSYDGWETRRRREPGDDFVIVRLGVPGVVRSVDIDTGWFKGNYPPLASVDATTVLGYPSAEELEAADWVRLVDKAELAGDAVNSFDVQAPDQLATHVRLTIHPDGGVARFRVYGEVVPDPRRLGGRVDLAAIVHGGVIDGCSNRFYSDTNNVLKPGVAQVMSDGWETARRRDDGNDWLTVRLGLPGVLHEVVVDTSRFVGNAPGWVRVSDADTDVELLPRTRVQPDVEHTFRLQAADIVRRVRLDVYPDGGLSRFRVRGVVADEARDQATQRWLALLPQSVADAVDPADFYA